MKDVIGGIDFTRYNPVDPLDRFEIARTYARYKIESSLGEKENCQTVLRAQQVQGKSYVDYNYFKENGLTDDGRLIDELDKARGDDGGKTTVNYLLARPKVGERDTLGDAAIRFVSIGPNGSLEDLPTYAYFHDILEHGVGAKIQNLVDIYGKGSVKELAALATENRAAHIGAYELMRASVQNAVMKEVDYGHREVYIASLTSKSLGPVRRFTGDGAIEVLGDDRQIYKDSPYASEEIWATPVMIDPSKVVDGWVDSIEAASDLNLRNRYVDHLCFLIDGLDEKYIGRRAANYMNTVGVAA